MATERAKSQILETAVSDTWDTAVRQLIRDVGDNPQRVDVQSTPLRLRNAFVEMLQGYKQDPHEFLRVQFDSTHDEMIIVKDLPFVSLCEHHMLPFTGTVAVGYIPARAIVGLSKIPRTVQALAQRLQVQERLTCEIADAFNECVTPRGVAVYVQSTHSCMSCRGVKSAGSMVTSALRGVMKTNPEARAEFLQAVRS